MLIKPTDKSIKGLLEGGFYKIPRFQRPYSWDQENVDDFWTDAIAGNESDYFIGSFVVYREPGEADVHLVVDGQQRLTTTTILLAVLRNALDSLGETQLAIGTQLLIERSDVNNKKRFVLQTETSYPYFHEFIQKYGEPAVKAQIGREEEAIESAFKYLAKQVEAVLESVDNDPALSVEKKAGEKKARLVRIRDNVLRLQLILVELQSEDDAYIIFETLNTRGKDLGIADLVKNLLARLLKPKNVGVDLAKDKWNSILDRFDQSEADIDANAFVYHGWISRYPYTGREKLFREIKGRITKPHAVAYLDSLVSDSDLYRQILEPANHKWTKQQAELSASLRALVLFRVGQALPMILAILRAYRADDIALAKAKAILRSMENFHVQFTALTAQRTGGGTAKMYAAAAQDLTNSKSSQQRSNAIATFRMKLRQRVPTFDEFRGGFGVLEFTTANTKQKGLVQYLLQRIDQYHRVGAAIDYNAMTIEHIAPESPPAGTQKIEGVGKMGNLILLDAKTNNDVANKLFLEKKNAYANAGFAVFGLLKNSTSWSKAEIDARTDELAHIAFNKIFKV